VYVARTPNATLSPQQLAQGIFAFHSCVRVRVAHLTGETIFGNQDGDGQQENIDYFQAPPAGGGAPAGSYKQSIKLRNDDPLHSKFFYLGYDQSKVPSGWKVTLNGGKFGVQLGPNAIRAIPVSIVPSAAMPLGKSAAVTVFASSLRLLTNDKNPKDKHPDFKQLGGVTIEGHAVARTKLRCVARREGDGVVFTGKLRVSRPGKLNPKVPVFLAGLSARRFRTAQAGYARLRRDGTFRGVVRRGRFVSGICMFAGTSTLGTATSGRIKVR
jgi:hypothetical protein